MLRRIPKYKVIEVKKGGLYTIPNRTHAAYAYQKIFHEYTRLKQIKKRRKERKTRTTTGAPGVIISFTLPKLLA